VCIEENCLNQTVLLTAAIHDLCRKMTDVRMVRPGSEQLLEQVSGEVGSGVNMISLRRVPPRQTSSHLLRHTCDFQTFCYQRSQVCLGVWKICVLLYGMVKVVQTKVINMPRYVICVAL